MHNQLFRRAKIQFRLPCINQSINQTVKIELVAHREHCE